MPITVLEYTIRESRINGDIAAASAGDRQAWNALGAMGRPAVPLPGPVGSPYLSQTAPAGWTASDWGSSYNPLRDKARQAYLSLASRFSGATGGPADKEGFLPVKDGTITETIPAPSSPCSTCLYNPNPSGPSPIPGPSGPAGGGETGGGSSTPTADDTAASLFEKAKSWPWWVWLIILLVALMLVRKER